VPGPTDLHHFLLNGLSEVPRCALEPASGRMMSIRGPTLDLPGYNESVRAVGRRLERDASGGSIKRSSRVESGGMAR
jgi:hypothetical protein